jgi:3-oxoacyl-[acyl-carrier-protein] synthase II
VLKRSAVITGLGIVSPIGIGTEDFWASACAGRSGIGYPTLFDASKLPRECQMVGEVSQFDPRRWMPGHVGRTAGRFSQFAVAAAAMARDDARLRSANITAERLFVSIGTSMGGLVDVSNPNFHSFIRGEPMAPWTALEYPGHAATSHVAISGKGRGQIASFSAACVAGLDAIAWAAERVVRGDATAVIAGGTEAPLSEASLEAFRALGALSKWMGPPSEASRPFDRMRSGLVLAEGAGIVVVEDEANARARGASVYARILGCGSVTEGAHMRELDGSGQSVARSIQLALEAAGLHPESIDYVSAHGNSLPDYDSAETAGLKLVLGRRAESVPVSSIKSMCGQALAASGAMQAVATCLAIRHKIIPPTINYQFPDPACDLDYVPNVARKARVLTAVLHAQSIGGSHTSLVLASPD